jgi:hypothetical protein
VSEKTDLRRKLEAADYSRIRMMLSSNYTKREVADLYHVSTKFIGKISDGYFTFNADGSTSFTMTQDPITPEFALSFPCSGCLYSFGSFSGLQAHYAVYTSGGSKALECMNLIVH